MGETYPSSALATNPLKKGTLCSQLGSAVLMAKSLFLLQGFFYHEDHEEVFWIFAIPFAHGERGLKKKLKQELDLHFKLVRF
jgi:hypothetical protein